MKPTGQMHLRGHPELFWRRCGIWNRFRKFCICRPTIKNVTGTFEKNWFSEEIHKITPDNMKPTGQMHLVTIYFNKKSLLGAITPWELTQSWVVPPSPQAGLVMDYLGETTSGAPHGLHADLVIGFLQWYRAKH